MHCIKRICVLQTFPHINQVTTQIVCIRRNTLVPRLLTLLEAPLKILRYGTLQQRCRFLFELHSPS